MACRDPGIYGSVPDPSLNNVQSPGYREPDGRETISDWTCEPGCPVLRLDEISGERRSAGFYPSEYRGTGEGAVYGEGRRHQGTLYEDTGGASRFFKQVGGEIESP